MEINRCNTPNTQPLSRSTDQPGPVRSIRGYSVSHLTASQQRIAGDFINYLFASQLNGFHTTAREGWIVGDPDKKKEAIRRGATTMSQVLDFHIYGDFLPVGEREKIRRALGMY